MFLEKITFFLENKNIEEFNNILLYYFIFIASYEIINFSVKKWWWMETLPLWKADILNHYLKKYIKLDNNNVEKVWTGKLIWIIDKWADEWIIAISNIIEKWTGLLISVLFSIYMVSRNWIFLWLGFTTLLIIFFVLWRYSNFKLWDFRKVRYELRNEWLKIFVKIIMSKIEILQNKKIKSEISKIYSVSGKLAEINKEMSFHRNLLMRVSQFGVGILLLWTFWFMWNKYI